MLNAKNEMLIVHPTNARHDQWSIPKGVIEQHEKVIEAAKRELFEETNIYLDFFKPVYVLAGDNVVYANKKKTLCPVYAKIFDDIDGIELRCNSMVELKGRKPFPENDKIEWVDTGKAMKLIHPTQVTAFQTMILR